MFFQRTDKEKKNRGEIKVCPDNRALFFIWYPKVENKPTEAKRVISAINEARRKKERIDAHVGHVAMALPNAYASLWPAESAGGNHFKVVKATFSDIESDIYSEGGPPDLLVSLYSLESQTMEAALEEIQASKDGFALAGDTSSTRLSNKQKGRNCNGLVYELLQRGGVDKITPFCADSNFVFYISPDKFATYIKSVKAKELAMYPETATFPQIEGEYVPEEKAPESSCVLQ